MGIETEHEIPSASAPGIFTATAIFMKDDVNTYNYFKDYPNEIDETTGPAIAVLLVEPVDKGDARAVVRVFDPDTAEGKRFPTLQHGDLPCLWLQDRHGGTAIIHINDDLNNAKQILRAMADAAKKTDSAIDMEDRVKAAMLRALGNNPFIAWLMQILEKIAMFNLPNDKVAIASGAVFILTMLVIALAVPHPSDFQYFVFRSVLALSAAAFATAIPGILSIQLGNWLKAGGALAVLVLVYLFNPASLVIGAGGG
jgi:hypothetical protein